MGNVARQDVPGVNDTPVLVIWHDAHAGTSNWEHIDDISDHEPYVVNSVGFLLNTRQGGKKNHVSVAQSFSYEGYVDSLIHIPKKMVVEIIHLERPAHATQLANRKNHSPIPGTLNPQGA